MCATPAVRIVKKGHTGPDVPSSGSHQHVPAPLSCLAVQRACQPGLLGSGSILVGTTVVAEVAEHPNGCIGVAAFRGLQCRLCHLSKSSSRL